MLTDWAEPPPIEYFRTAEETLRRSVMVAETVTASLGVTASGLNFRLEMDAGPSYRSSLTQEVVKPATRRSAAKSIFFIVVLF